MPVKSVTTGITCARPQPAASFRHVFPPCFQASRGVSDTPWVTLSRNHLKPTTVQTLSPRRRATTGSARPFSWLSARFWQGQCTQRCCLLLLAAACLCVPTPAFLLTLSRRYTIWFDKIDRLPYMLYTLKQNARKQQIENILKYAMEKGLTIPSEIAKTPELHRITYVGSKILADQLVFSSL
jgi:hypothetical protein